MIRVYRNGVGIGYLINNVLHICILGSVDCVYGSTNPLKLGIGTIN